MSQVNKAFEANEGGWSNGSEKVRGLSAVRQYGFIDGRILCDGGGHSPQVV